MTQRSAMCPVIGKKCPLWHGCWRRRSILWESTLFLKTFFTLASYYQADLRDTGLLPEGWQTLPADELDEPMLSTLPKPAMPERAEQLRLEEETNARRCENASAKAKAAINGRPIREDAAKSRPHHWRWASRRCRCLTRTWNSVGWH